MTEQRTRVWVAAGCLLLAFASQAAELDGRQWLQRMSEALVERNYDGRFIHSSEARSETMRIVHRNRHGKVTERLVSMDGNEREYVRTDTEVSHYMPDQRTVLVEARNETDPLLTVIPKYSPGLEAYYDISTGPVVRLLGRKAQLVAVQPRDEYRYGYRLWLDAESAMPLKSQMFDRMGRIIEQVVFAQLDMPERIDDKDLKPEIDTSGYQWIRQEVRLRKIGSGDVTWRVKNPPPGFKLKVTRLQPMAGSDKPVRHLVYTDGLATVSVFIDEITPREVRAAGLQRVGSTVAYQAEASGVQVTALGEVPAVTVKRMVASLVREPAAK